MGGRKRHRAVLSLRDRALAALAIGITVLAALGVFEAADARSLTDTEPTLATFRALETDNLVLAAGMNLQDSGLTTYVQALTLDPATLRGLGGRETLLADYNTGSGQVADVLVRVRQESAALKVTRQEQPVEAAVRAWQTWAQQRRTAAEANAGRPVDSALDSEG